MADYRLEQLNSENAAEWEEFNASSTEGSIFHSLKWKQLAESCSGISCRYFLLFKDDEMAGLFPFIDHKIHLFHGLVPANNPMSIHAVLRDHTDPDAMPYVIQELQNLHRDQKKLSFIGISTSREETLGTIAAYPQFPYAGDGDMVLDLTENPPEKIWNSFSKKKGQRKFIRRFEKHGFELTEVQTDEDLRLFYEYYEANIRHIKGTLHPFSFIADMRDALSDDVRITLLSKGPVFAGGMFQLHDKPRKISYQFFLALNRGLPNTYHATYFLDWEGIVWAWENGYEKVSFGTEYSNDLNGNNPRYVMKKDFGAQFKPIYSRIIPLSRLFSMGVKLKNL